jgi:broad specificity phosphatase PhoE
MREQLLIRHAETDLDPGVPPERWGLTATGVQQAHAAGDHLRSAGLVAMFSSMEPKAQRTAELIAGQRV